MGGIMDIGILLDEQTGASNRLRMNDDGGVVTEFCGVVETYQMGDEARAYLSEIMEKHVPGEMLKRIPAPKLVDLAVDVTEGVYGQEKAGDIIREFLSEEKYINGYSCAYLTLVAEGVVERFVDSAARAGKLEEEMKRIGNDLLVHEGRDSVVLGEHIINDGATPETVQIFPEHVKPCDMMQKVGQ